MSPCKRRHDTKMNTLLASTRLTVIKVSLIIQSIIDIHFELCSVYCIGIRSHHWTTFIILWHIALFPWDLWKGCFLIWTCSVCINSAIWRLMASLYYQCDDSVALEIKLFLIGWMHVMFVRLTDGISLLKTICV